MIVDIQTRRLRTIGQLCAFIEGNEAVIFQPQDRDGVYTFIRETLVRFGYVKLGKRDKGVVLKFLVVATGLSRQQMERLVRRWRETGAIRDRRGGSRGRPFARKYSGADIRLLAEVDKAFEQMSGLATREILRRQYEVFGDPRFERLATISNGHIYNLRASSTYRAKRTVWTKTRAVTVSIGLRQAPQPDGRPGHVRVDTVHQGDRDGEKGVYLINLVDEVTQFEFVGAVVGISERFLVPLLEGLLLSFPFPILGFHADNGSEYINHRVAALLEKLRVGRFTKSRARHSNDNALVEGKNANVIRKWFGHDHIPQRFAPEVNRFAQATLSPFLNFHRPCLFATEYRDNQGRIRRKYLAEHVMTPYAKLRSLADAEHLLKPGVRFALLDAMATAETDLEAVRRVQAERRELFRLIGDGSTAVRAAGRCAAGGDIRRPNRPVDLWTSPSDRPTPCGPCGQPVDNAPGARCPPPAHTRGPLAHNSTGPTTKFFHKTPAPPDPMSSIQTNRLARNHPSRS